MVLIDLSSVDKRIFHRYPFSLLPTNLYVICFLSFDGLFMFTIKLISGYRVGHVQSINTFLEEKKWQNKFLSRAQMVLRCICVILFLTALSTICLLLQLDNDFSDVGHKYCFVRKCPC